MNAEQQPQPPTQVIEQFNNTALPLPVGERLIDLFEQHAHNHPVDVALIYGDSPTTYAELNARANQIAGQLQTAGVQPGSVVVVVLERSVNYVATVLAVLKHAATYLPIDAANPDERLNYILADSQAHFLVTSKAIDSHRQLKWSHELVYVDDAPRFAGAFQCSNAYNNRLYILYTSGSTGKPKGVIGTQQGLLNRLHWGWNTYPYITGELCSQYMSLSFVDHVAEMFSPLLKGVPVVIAVDEEISNVERLAKMLLQHKVSRITIVPSLLQALTQLKKARNIQFTALRYVFCSGEVLPFYLAQQFYQEFGHARLVNIYGSTEVGGDVTCINVDRYRVEEVLGYFRQTFEGNFLKNEQWYQGQGSKEFTVANVPLEALAPKFQNSAISEYPMAVDEYYAWLHQEVIPYTINTASPTFIGHMTSVLPDYVHDISKLISQLNQNVVKIETSKAVTFLEREAVAILHRVFYNKAAAFYDDHTQKLNSVLGIITSGGSLANVSALLSARNKALLQAETDKDILYKESTFALLHKQGYRDMVLIGTQLMHYSFKKAASVLGLGTNNLLHVQHDNKGRMILSDLEAKVEHCRKNRLLIIAIVGIAGSTERGNIDPLPEIGQVAARHGIHFHVDAAWGGALIFSDKYKGLLKGIEQADTITFCGHKQLFLPQGVSACLAANPHQFHHNSITANYQATANSYDTGRFTLEGSRPALAMCLHASLRVLGKKGYELLVNNGIEKAITYAQMLQAFDCFELLSRQMNIINYRYIPEAYRQACTSGQLTAAQNQAINTTNEQIQQRQFYKGKTFISKTTIQHLAHGSIVVFRTVLSNPLTTRDDLIEVLADQLQVIREVTGEHIDITHNMAAGDGQPPQPQAPTYQQVTIGKPIANTQIYILDARQKPVPVGEQGELYVAGAGLAEGYWQRSQLTEASFVPNPFVPGTLMFKTGDLGSWKADGTIDFYGRIGNQIKVNGNRVEPAEVEHVLLELEQVHQAAVLPMQGHSGTGLTAFIVKANTLTVEALQAHMASRLPAYMVPRNYVVLSELPVNPNGKLDRQMLQTLNQQATSK